MEREDGREGETEEGRRERERAHIGNSQRFRAVETYGGKQERHREKKAASLDPAPALSRERSRSLTTSLFSHRSL